jgi:hypothetical protein
MRKKKDRVIEQLRKLISGKWKYKKRSYHWEHESGFYIYACALYSPRWDCDDNFITQYRRNDTGEQLVIFTSKEFGGIFGIL